MGKFVEQLKRVGQRRAATVGFARAAAQNQSTNMLVAVYLEELDASLIKKASSQGANAIMVAPPNKIEESVATKFSGSLSDVPWGITLTPGDLGDSHPLGEPDFVVLKDLATPANVLGSDKRDVLLALDTALPDAAIRAADALAVGALVIELAPSDVLTIEHLIACQRVALLTQKPVIASIPSAWGADVLPHLRDVGIKCVLLNLAGAEVGKVAEFCEAARALGPPRSPFKELDAMVPASAFRPSYQKKEEEDEEEEDSLHANHFRHH
ncbi:MAG: hypothetical protein HW403_132 [Dehalococcoidia bacterium]|nr:hypothetical protein [Dehalococcoidia bacterium]